MILGFNDMLNRSLQGIDLIDELLPWMLYNTNTVVITPAHAFAPFAILPIFVALKTADRWPLTAAVSSRNRRGGSDRFHPDGWGLRDAAARRRPDRLMIAT